jgi:hypothetical protein
MTKKEIRNIEIDKVVIECKYKCHNTLKAVFGSVDDRELTDIVNENLKSIFNGKLKSARFTGTPESIREIEDLTCNWDYSEIALSISISLISFFVILIYFSFIYYNNHTKNRFNYP